MLSKLLNNKMKNKIIVPDEIIENKIFSIRGKRVMFDKDLAVLYGVETRTLNQAVRRNNDRFSDDFMFQLTKPEFDIWKSQIVISNAERMGLRKMPLVFTEQGVAMLSSVLKSKRAIQVNIQIMRTFTKIREMIISNKELRLKIEAMERKYDNKFQSVFDAIKRILITQVKEKPERKNKIGFRY
ncbi:MAG: hypothetical protein UR66_C0009G0093 [Candidatus Moranbacteria bacterium GW2011_GWE1_35_17]|nr:MAG: hypothetical protein UR65_C0069G0006 [Candidatus Moranbacteria bacterium GW2011_GWE2_35_164]KKP68003.1 MAG: hypothetical protein UR66_C0009G0093 [Candidatus Moranbacteria bacterium GW2011_GWE1_35_17]KKP82295.1 MAG: hypothetical protein UR82_C0040G0004 [Candidatus Moranbacteria bacterium GW2011_GWF1_35_5]KKP82445.1 MAG: hypothetical protein UR83_C0052G0016 [Candidatus Moranbacteria bacterium GW2011_GWF2_35_54]